MKIKESIVIERSPNEVFAFFDDRRNDPRWLSSVVESQWLDPTEPTGVGRKGRAVMDVMGRREFHDEVTRYEPGRLVEHRQVSGPVVMDTACIAEPHGSGTHVTITYVPKRFPGGIFGWLVAPFAVKTVRRMYRGDLARLKELLELDGKPAEQRGAEPPESSENRSTHTQVRCPMSDPTLYRLCAAALVASAALTVSGRWTHPAVEVAAMTTPLWALTHVLLWFGAAAAVVGLVGLYLRRREQVGKVGAAGAGLTCVGLIALSGAYYYEVIVVPALAEHADAVMRTFPAASMWRPYAMLVAASGALIAFGFLLFGTALWRAAAAPRWTIVVATAGATTAGLQFLLPGPIALLAFLTLGVGLTALGSQLWASASNPSGRRSVDATVDGPTATQHRVSEER